MTSFEAVQWLAARARRTARVGWLIGAGAIVLVLGATLTVMILRGASGRASGRVASAAAIVASLIIIPSVHFVVKALLRLRRPRWIEELARTEGLSAERIAEFFTLDSY